MRCERCERGAAPLKLNASCDHLLFSGGGGGWQIIYAPLGLPLGPLDPKAEMAGSSCRAQLALWFASNAGFGWGAWFLVWVVVWASGSDQAEYGNDSRTMAQASRLAAGVCFSALLSAPPTLCKVCKYVCIGTRATSDKRQEQADVHTRY